MQGCSPASPSPLQDPGWIVPLDRTFVPLAWTGLLSPCPGPDWDSAGLDRTWSQLGCEGSCCGGTRRFQR